MEVSQSHSLLSLYSLRLIAVKISFHNNHTFYPQITDSVSPVDNTTNYLKREGANKLKALNFISYIYIHNQNYSPS